tara:strand:+ start:1345 stop:1860 length:516 start_codon:yes stop_codon:yes gene_type:complete
MNWNPDQRALIQWITAGLKIREVRDLKGDSGYLLSNMIAKVTLAHPEYYISNEALKIINQMNIDLKERHKRGKFYGKKQPFVYEHSIPASIVRSQLLENAPLEESEVENILLSAGSVAMILREEDKKLSSMKLARKMPQEWVWGGDEFARYKAAGIEISKEKLLTEGPICR